VGSPRLEHGQEIEAQKDFDRSLALNPDLRSKIDQYFKDKQLHAIK
jgi:hypothetical protein